MRIGLVSTGDELLRGELADTNGAWISAELHERGHDVTRISVVVDDLAGLAAELEAAFEAFDLVLVGGGRGPTDDDRTARAAALAAGLKLERNDEAAAQVRAAFDRIGRKMSQVNLKQADLPAGCRVLANSSGTAPGFEIDTPTGGRALFFPGVPAELKAMFTAHVPSVLPEQEDRRRTAVLKCFGLGESDIQAALTELTEPGDSVRYAFRASFPEIRVTISASTDAALKRVSNAARDKLGRVVFADEDIGLPAALGRALYARGLTIATAESCTGGLIGHSITDVPGSSEFFRGGVVAYANEAKTSLLGVSSAKLEAEGAVSEAIVTAMAEGARRALRADLALATSGIAGPDGGTREKPVGLVHMAVAHPAGISHESRIFKGYDRQRVKKAAAWTTMRMALHVVWEHE